MALATIAVAGAAHASAIGIFDTGVDASGNPLPNGTLVDPHYVLAGVPGGTTVVLTRTSAGGNPIGPWLADDALSTWIGPDNDSSLDGPFGRFDYRTTFDLTGFDLTAVVLAGHWATDNSGVDILINGASTGNTAGGFSAWYAFTVNSGFVAGLNTLDFLVNNAGGPTGLRVEFSGNANANAIPEPASLFLLGAGLTCLGLFRRKNG